jgi:hypothetical protein
LSEEMMRLQLSSAAGSEAAAVAARGAAGDLAGSAAAGSRGSPPHHDHSASNDLMGNSLASYFSQLFEKQPLEQNEKR